MAGVSVPLSTTGSVALRLGLGCGSGVSSDTPAGAAGEGAGAGAAWGAGGGNGTNEGEWGRSEISSAGPIGGRPLGLRSGSGTIDTCAAWSDVGLTVGAGEAAATCSPPGAVGLRSGTVGLGVAAAIGLRSDGVS